jgi:hypothetical protein
MRRYRPPVLRSFVRELDRPYRTRPVAPEPDDPPDEEPHTIVSSAGLGWVIKPRAPWIRRNRRLVFAVGACALLFMAIWIAGFSVLSAG